MGDNLDFGAQLYFKLFEVNGQPVYLTQTIVSTWLIMLGLILVAVILRVKMRKFKEVPETKLQTTVEMIVDMINNFTISSMGPAGKKFAGYYGPLLIYIAVCNLSGLIGIRPPTADFATTLAFALITFFMIHGFGIKSKGVGYFKGFLEPFPLLLPINIIGELATPVSLSFRLFGNILGGSKIGRAHV